MPRRLGITDLFYLIRNKFITSRLFDNPRKILKICTDDIPFYPIVTIVIPVYNGANYLRDAIDSALAQSYTNIEVIVVNDGSSDEGQTEAIAMSYGERIRYFSKINGGVASALNMGISMAQGEYVSWLSHDDLYLPNKIERQITLLGRQTNKRVIIYSDYEALDVANNKIQTCAISHILPYDYLQDILSLLFSADLHGCTLLLPRACFVEAGFFNEQLKTTQDYDLWFKLLRQKYEFVHLPEVQVRARRHQDQGTYLMLDIHLREVETLYSWAFDQFREEIIKYPAEQIVNLIMQLRRRSLRVSSDYMLKVIQQIRPEIYFLLRFKLSIQMVVEKWKALLLKTASRTLGLTRVFVKALIPIDLIKMVILKTLPLLLWSGIYRLMAKLFKFTADTGKGSNICLKEGFLPVPVHFHSTLPDIRDLEERNVWAEVSDLAGIDFRIAEQISLIKSLGSCFAEECNWPLEVTEDPAQFYLQNPSFSYGCASSTHCMIRKFKPSKVIEIGSGMSSKVIATALGMNRCDGIMGSYCIVDPYPGEIVCDGYLKGVELVKNRVELLDPVFFNSLKSNDILFIDSSHSVKIGGDVNYLYLNVLPRLAPGVLVHIHDISFPYEYSRSYATNESFRQFWTEQYLLQGFLAFNNEFEVLLGMNYLMVDQVQVFRKVFPHYSPTLHPFISGSFWMRRKNTGDRCI